MQLLYRLADFWPHAVAFFTLLSASLASAHAILHKRDARATTLWLGFIWLLPLLGPGLYLILGVNRVRRKAVSLRGMALQSAGLKQRGTGSHEGFEASCADALHLAPLAQAMDRIVRRPLTSGNLVRPLINGDEAYPEMLAAIEGAKQSISLSTYIFDNDSNGRRFVAALQRAVERGVEARVLVDAAGARYSTPSIIGALRMAKVPAARFLPGFAPWRMMAMNLRNHRKILVVDGKVGFTGGMNLREGNLVAQKPPHPVQDLHFRVEGPVVGQLQEAFTADWFFVTTEWLQGEKWFPALIPAGGAAARAVADGPDEDFEMFWWTIMAALSCARQSVRIMTPYFVPGNSIVSALNMAALRGVRVDILLPAQNNLPYVHWASRAMWWQVLERGCSVWLTEPPFDHSKLIVVDGAWTLLGSGNWDTRSLRLNFEFNVECYGTELARVMEKHVDAKLRNAHQVTKEEVDARSGAVKLRDGVIRLFSPFL